MGILLAFMIMFVLPLALIVIGGALVAYVQFLNYRDRKRGKQEKESVPAKDVWPPPPRGPMAGDAVGQTLNGGG